VNVAEPPVGNKEGMGRPTKPANSAVAIGEKIRAYRLERQVTQTGLARQIGIQQSDLSRMEKGEYRVPLDVLFRILRALELSFGDFFGDLVKGDLTSRESSLLQSFRLLSREDQEELIEFAEFKRSRD
jgi:transcriptional regulator with XRE-family HTH domain